VPGAERSLPALSIRRRGDLRWTRRRGCPVGARARLSERGFVLHIHIIQVRRSRAGCQADDLATPLDWPPFFEWAHLSGLEPARAHPYDRRAFTVGRLPVQEDDVKTVSLFSILLARRLFAHDALSA
jgi:hypothetical protein